MFGGKKASLSNFKNEEKKDVNPLVYSKQITNDPNYKRDDSMQDRPPREYTEEEMVQRRKVKRHKKNQRRLQGLEVSDDSSWEGESQ